MELELDREELRILSGEILSLLRMRGGTDYSDGVPSPRAHEERASQWGARSEISEWLSMTEREYGRGFLSPEPGMAGEAGFLGGTERIRRRLPESAVRLTSYSAPGAEGSSSARRMRAVEETSERLRKDSRRYDGVLEKY